MHNHVTITIDNLTFELRRSARRKTIGITIGRMGELILSAPLDCPLDSIECVVREKYRWIYTKLARKEMLFNPPVAKRFVDGEGFYYLGRSYRLRLVPALDNPPLELHNDRFLLREDAIDQGETHFTNWYIAQGRIWLQERVDLFRYRVGAEPRAIKVQPLGYHWGSCGRNNVLYFHWRTMLLPPSIIDYIIVHELVHLRGERHHQPSFWELVAQAIPDYAARKRWLAENGNSF